MASCYTEPPTLSTWVTDDDEEEKEPKSPEVCSSDESEESEPELSVSVVRRKVSFADAFGLDLVSVKEFDNRVESAEGREGEEYYLSCIFSVPATDEELVLRLWQNKLELERIELLPGSTTIRGTVRVLNLSYNKIVYVRTTLDGWQTHFDQLAEYVPGSSDGATDRFSFQLTLMPPFPPNGARVEFCLCYESATGHFWANNGGMNYVLFCHKRGGRALNEKEEGKERETEESDQKGKKSCLKKESCVESKPTDMSSELSEQDTTSSVENKKGRTQHKAESRSTETIQDTCKTLAERRNKRRAAQLAYLKDYFSHREPEIQQGQPSHQEKSKRDLNVVLPIPQHSISLLTDTSSTLQVCSSKEQNGITSSILPEHQIELFPLDLGRDISFPSEIISGTRLDVLQKEQTKGMSTESTNDVWKAFLNGTDILDYHNNALEQKSLLCITESNASQPSNAGYDVSNTGDKKLSVWITQECAVNSGNDSHQRDLSQAVPSYKYPEKGQNSSEPHAVEESESIRVQWRSGDTDYAPHNKPILIKKCFCEDEPMLLTRSGETTYEQDTTEPRDSKPGDGVDTEMKVKGHTHGVIKENWIFTEIRNKPFIDSRESLERQHTDESREPMEKKENISEENENASQIKRISSSEYSENASVVLESRQQEYDEEPSLLKDMRTEICISLTPSVVRDESVLDKQTCSGEEEDASYELLKKGFPASSDNQGEEMSLSCKKSKNALKADGQGIDERHGEVDDYDLKNDLYMELQLLQSTPEPCPHTCKLCITSQASSSSALTTWADCVTESEFLHFPATHKGSDSEETLRYRVAQDLHDPVVGTEFTSSLCRTTSPALGIMYSWLLLCWAKVSTLNYITGTLMCTILFLIFITAYLHDLPVCLVIYLLSACWWCRQGMKKSVTTDNSAA